MAEFAVGDSIFGIEPLISTAHKVASLEVKDIGTAKATTYITVCGLAVKENIAQAGVKDGNVNDNPQCVICFPLKNAAGEDVDNPPLTPALEGIE